MRQGRARHYAALHGFGSSPRSRKNEAFAAAFEARGISLHRPDLNRPTFATLTFSGMLEALDEMDRSAGEPRWSIVASSLGGYVAALWAEAHPERVERLVLLCPAFELAARWSVLVTPEEGARWAREGSLPFADASGAMVPLHHAFVDEARTIAPMPSPRCPTLVIHGRADSRVPIESSRRFVAAEGSRQLIEVDDGHDLLADVPWLCRTVIDFLTEESP